MTDCRQLLADYARTRSEPAFREIVTRYLDFVYSTARRLVDGDEHRAKDIAQIVFVDLAKKAGELSPDVMLGGWLHRHTCFVAANVQRSERRRLAREREAVEMNSLHENAGVDFARLAPLLDATINQLDDADRTAILLRYFEQKDFRTVGHALDSSEDAARMRVKRALDKLRDLLAQRGIHTTAGALGIVISTNAVQAAPVGLAGTISTGVATLAGSAPASSSTTALLKVISATKIKLVAGVLITALAIPLALLYRQNVSLKKELAALRNATNRLNAASPIVTASSEGNMTEEERRRLRLEHLELLGLRGRTSQLASELRQQRAGTVATNSLLAPASDSGADSILFSASLTNRVASGQTLVVGGWSAREMRRYLLITPVVPDNGGDSANRKFTIQSQVVTAPESFWNQIGWEAAKSGTHRSTLAGLLIPEQLAALLAALKETKDADVSNTSLVERHNGEFVGFGFSTSDDSESGALMGVDIYPWISADGHSVDLEIRPSPVTASTPIHPSLK